MSVKDNNENIAALVDAYDVFGVMSALLEQPDKPDLSTANLWVIALDKSESILNLELCGMGNYRTIVAEPADIFSIPLQKKAFGIILIHNTTTSSLIPSEEDIDVTDRLNQAGSIVNIKLLDHLIITEGSFYGFKDNGLMDQIYKSGKYVPSYDMEQRLKKEISDMAKKMASAEQLGRNMGKIEGKVEVAESMLKQGYDLEKVASITGLSLDQVKTLV
jgi:DNA repair protein RadC